MKQKFLFIMALLLTMSLGTKAQQQWEFASVSDEDIALLQADQEANGANSEWFYSSDNNRWSNQVKHENAAVMANGQELEYTKGLLLTFGGQSDKSKEGSFRIDIKSNRMWISSGSITIPNLTAGQVVTVKYMSSSQTVARGIAVSNLTYDADKQKFGTNNKGGKGASSAITDVGTVTEDGDVTLTMTSANESSFGMYMYFISVEDPDDDEGGGESGGGGGDEPTPPAEEDYSVSANSMKNQAVLTLRDGSVRYYNTEDVTTIQFVDNNVEVQQAKGSYTFENKVADVSFKKADAGQSGSTTNVEGKVKITESRGWLESAYVKFEPFEGAKTYNVYVKGGQFADYTLIDGALVRNYTTYGRADALGLTKASNYALKVVPVDADGKEMTENANETTGLTVENYDRSGFAHKGLTEGLGAYNNDGSLKTGANVVYVTGDNAKTVSLDIATAKGGGKTATYTGLQQIIYGYQKGDNDGSFETKPLCIRIIGTITADDCDKFLSSAEGIQIKGAKAYQKMNITIEGVGDDATTTGFGFLIRSASNIELRNFANMLCMDDAVSIDTDNSHIWVHNLDLFYGNAGGEKDQAKGDGTIDMKGDSQFITVAYNHLWDSGKASLCGMKSESGPNWITYHHNWFDHSDSRHPRIRTMSVHVYNNYFDGNSKYGVGAAYRSNAFVENNFFRNCKFPMLSSMQGNDVYAGSSTYSKDYATFSSEDGGIIKAYNNHIEGTTSSYWPYAGTSLYTKGSYKSASSLGVNTTTHFDAYEVTDKSQKVPETVVAVQGGSKYNNFDTDASLFYTYTPDAPEDVPGIVTGWLGAGRIGHGDLQWAFDNATEDTNYAVIAALKAALQSYKSKFAGFLGDTDIKGGSGSGSGDDPGTGGDDPGTGGDDPGTGGDDPVVLPTGTLLVSFNETVKVNGEASTAFTVAGSYGDGKITYNETYYKKGVKLDSKGSITFTPDKNYNMTIILGTAKSGRDVKINNIATTVSGAENTQGLYCEMEPIAITSGTEYKLTKGSAEALVMLIKLEPVE